jgi:hypothetical protein
MWSAPARSRALRAVRAPDGEATTVAMTKMRELAALDLRVTPAQRVRHASGAC